MNLPVKILQSAQADYRNLKKSVTRQLGEEVWGKLNRDIQATIKTISEHPHAGSALEELEEIGSGRYRQIYVGKNRIVYEVRTEAIYVHIFMHVRRDLMALLQDRLLS
ncbi:type II toxin-antitoxin system RelE/ParE family toxin [Herbaspirillum lusitanum]|uniref:Type II toxin-antitoxin system RelE/ParE family toxin n=1 Tax=Herbaspirillum lusitanum TaxID=213312 RepID=A0ABW9AA42_9BURK